MKLITLISYSQEEKFDQLDLQSIPKTKNKKEIEIAFSIPTQSHPKIFDHYIKTDNINQVIHYLDSNIIMISLSLKNYV